MRSRFEANVCSYLRPDLIPFQNDSLFKRVAMRNSSKHLRPSFVLEGQDMPYPFLYSPNSILSTCVDPDATFNFSASPWEGFQRVTLINYDLFV